MSVLVRGLTVVLFTTGHLVQAQAHRDDDEERIARCARALDAYRRAAELEAGEVWGLSVHGPLILIDPNTRFAVANQVDPDGRFRAHGDCFVGVAPQHLGASNTSVTWAGTEWATVRLPLPAGEYETVELLAHEAFHRIEGQVGVVAEDAVARHLDGKDARIWLRLELRALAAAVREEDDESAFECLLDAAYFRRQRQSVDPQVRVVEGKQEIAEGLASYTGAMVARHLVEDGPERIARLVDGYDGHDAYARSFAYATGPPLGWLLDRLGEEGWRERVIEQGEFTEELEATVDPDLLDFSPEEAAERAAAYDVDTVRTEEEAREQRFLARLERYRARLVDGPTLVLQQQSLSRSFDPTNVIPWPEGGTLYPTGEFRGPWGLLEVDGGGVLVTADFQRATVEAPEQGGRGVIQGNGWVLTLADGWQVLVNPDGSAELSQSGP